MSYLSRRKLALEVTRTTLCSLPRSGTRGRTAEEEANVQNDGIFTLTRWNNIPKVNTRINTMSNFLAFKLSRADSTHRRSQVMEVLIDSGNDRSQTFSDSHILVGLVS